MIDVLMPVFTDNIDGRSVEKYVRECLGSLIGQTYKKFRLVVVDDASDQHGMERLAHYCDLWNIKVKIIKNDENIGLTESLNKGLQHCTAKYIARQDIDDFSAPTRFEKQIAYLESHPDCAGVGCFYRNIDHHGDLFHMSNPQPSKLDLHQLAGSLAGGSATYRRDVINEVGGWRYRYAQDFYMNVEIKKAGYDLYNIPEYLYTRRTHLGQVSIKYEEEQAECHKSIKKPLTRVVIP